MIQHSEGQQDIKHLRTICSQVRDVASAVNEDVKKTDRVLQVLNIFLTNRISGSYVFLFDVAHVYISFPLFHSNASTGSSTAILLSLSLGFHFVEGGRELLKEGPCFYLASNWLGYECSYSGYLYLFNDMLVCTDDRGRYQSHISFPRAQFCQLPLFLMVMALQCHSEQTGRASSFLLRAKQ